jgi:fimbrial chaperone protein
MKTCMRSAPALPSFTTLIATAVLPLLLLLANHADAGPFEVGAMPTRYILSGKSSSRIGQSLSVYNLGAAPTELALRTLDWTYSEDGNVSYHEALLPNSCRPWVTLERKTLKLAVRQKRDFRFQIDVPADAPRKECRFMVVIEGIEPATKALLESSSAHLSVPVTGRIAIAVYLAVNGAEPKLEMKQVSTEKINGKRVPMLTVTNVGDAHGRLDGSLSAVDASKTEFELLPDASPILPGQTRQMQLLPKVEGTKTPAEMTFPVTGKGSIDWDKGSFKVAAEFK